MNKTKLVELADEVLTHIDMDMKVVLRDQLERALCGKLSRIFEKARIHNAPVPLVNKDKYQKAYASVQPILDDCIDRILGEKK